MNPTLKPQNQNILFVGDLHGDISLLERIIKKFPKHQYVFVGDLVDSFVFPHGDQLACVQTVIDLIQKERAQCLLGNHEWSYLNPRYQCSGWNNKMDALLTPHKKFIQQQFKNYIYYSDAKLLVTHAGLTKSLVDEFAINTDRLHNAYLDQWMTAPDRLPWFHVGRIRQGNDPIGGPLWCDFEWEFQPNLLFNQVFGHTPIARLTKRGNAYNIDCLQSAEKAVLEFNGTSLKKIKIR